MQTINKGDRIAQLVPMPFLDTIITEVDTLNKTTRGLNGFGSSGR